jgi:hypothetical protein
MKHAELTDSKENIHSGVNLATRKKGMEVCTSSDVKFSYVWNVDSEEKRQGRGKRFPFC